MRELLFLLQNFFQFLWFDFLQILDMVCKASILLESSQVRVDERTAHGAQVDHPFDQIELFIERLALILSLFEQVLEITVGHQQHLEVSGLLPHFVGQEEGHDEVAQRA